LQPDITLKDWLMVATLGFVWGASFLFIEIALEGITPFWLATWRITLAALLTCAVWQACGGQLYLSDEKASPVSLLAISAMSTALPFGLISWGQVFVTSGFAGVSMAAVGLMVLPLAHIFIPGERLTPLKVTGFAIGFVGVVILIGPEALSSSGAAGEVLGRLACLTGAACYAVSSIMLRRLPPMDPIGLSAVTLILGSLVVFGMAIVVEGAPGIPTAKVIGIIVVLGLVQTALANLLRIMVVRSAGPTFMSLTNYQVPIWSVILGILVLGEAATPALFVAMALILIGVAISQHGAFKRLLAR
jgi:drug/metabolite transporter (DMT)-like permease